MNTNSADQALPLIERSIGVVPLRSAEAAARLLNKYCVAALDARRGSLCEKTEAAFAKLLPFWISLLITHALEEGGMTLDTGDMQIKMAFLYGIKAIQENLSLPLSQAMEALKSDTPVTLTVYLRSLQSSASFTSLLSEINGQGTLCIVFVELTTQPLADTNDSLPKEDSKPLSEQGKRDSNVGDLSLASTQKEGQH